MSCQSAAAVEARVEATQLYACRGRTRWQEGGNNARARRRNTFANTRRLKARASQHLKERVVLSHGDSRRWKCHALQLIRLQPHDAKCRCTAHSVWLAVFTGGQRQVMIREKINKQINGSHYWNAAIKLLMERLAQVFKWFTYLWAFGFTECTSVRRSICRETL